MSDMHAHHYPPPLNHTICTQGLRYTAFRMGCLGVSLASGSSVCWCNAHALQHLPR